MKAKGPPLVDRYGNPVRGMIDVSLIHIDPSAPGLDITSAPSPYAGKTGAEEDILMNSVGMAEVSVEQLGLPSTSPPGRPRRWR